MFYFFKSYVACTRGIHNVGFFVILHGVTNTTGNILFGRLIKYTGTFAVFTFGLVTYYAILGIMYFWNPDQTPDLIYAMPSKL